MLTLPNIYTSSHRIVSSGRGIHVGDTFFSQTQNGDIYYDEPNFIEGHRLETLRANGGSSIRIAGTELGKVSQNCACGFLDVSWLPLAAKAYKISPDIKDYVLVDIPIVLANVPNRNGDCFTYKELTTFRPIIGMPAFKTFYGKPAHQDHDNMDPTRAKGVIFDATLTPFRGVWHVKILKGFDRTKDPRLAKLVRQKSRIGHSMGALVERTECGLPWCNFHSDGRITCDHINGGQGKGDIIKGHLVYENMMDYYFVECSSVEDPAYPIALSREIWGV